MLHERIIIAGSGGQGVVLAGRLLAGMALPHIAHITFFPAYGAEVRGGLSNCQLVFSDAEIASPVGAVFESMILMNDIGALRYRPALRDGGLCVFEADLCPSMAATDGLGIPATRMADAMGDRRAANFILIGAWIGARRLFPADRLETEVAAIFAGKPDAVRDRNLDAFHAGFKQGRGA